MSLKCFHLFYCGSTPRDTPGGLEKCVPFLHSVPINHLELSCSWCWHCWLQLESLNDHWFHRVVWHDLYSETVLWLITLLEKSHRVHQQKRHLLARLFAFNTGGRTNSGNTSWLSKCNTRGRPKSENVLTRVKALRGWPLVACVEMCKKSVVFLFKYDFNLLHLLMFLYAIFCFCFFYIHFKGLIQNHPCANFQADYWILNDWFVVRHTGTAAINSKD